MSPFLGVAGLGGAGSLLAEKLIPETKWYLTSGGTSSEFAQGFHRDNAGNFYSMSNTSSFGAGVYTHLMVKFDSEGVKQWDTCVGTNGQDYTNDYTKSITADSSGNVYACGTSSTYSPARNVLYKLNSSGTLQWARSMYRSSVGSQGGGVECDNAGNVYVFGGTSNNGYIIKVNSSGTQQWQINTGSGTRYGNATFDSSNNLYITGQRNNDLLVSKYDSSGNEQWSRKMYVASTWIYGRGIDLDSSGNVYVCGNYRPTNGGNPNGMVIAKFDSSGTYQWARRIYSPDANEDWADGLAVAADKIYINGSAGATGSYTPGFMAQYDTSGNIQWQRTFTYISGPSSGRYMNATGMAASSSGYVFPHYYQSFSGPGGYDIFIGKFPADGSETGTYGNFVYAASSVSESSFSSTVTSTTIHGGSSWGTLTFAYPTTYSSSVTSNLTYY